MNRFRAIAFLVIFQSQITNAGSLLYSSPLCTDLLGRVTRVEPYLSGIRSVVAQELGVTPKAKGRASTSDEVRDAVSVLKDLAIPPSQKSAILDVYLEKEVKDYIDDVQKDRDIREKNAIELLVEIPERGLLKAGNFPKLLTGQELKDQSYESPDYVIDLAKEKERSPEIDQFIEKHELKLVVAKAMSQGINIWSSGNNGLRDERPFNFHDSLVYEIAKMANRHDIVKIVGERSKKNFSVDTLLKIAKDTNDDLLAFEVAKVVLASSLVDGAFNLVSDSGKQVSFAILRPATNHSTVTYVLSQVGGKYKSAARDLLLDYIRLTAKIPSEHFGNLDRALEASLDLGVRVDGSTVRREGSPEEYLTRVSDPEVKALIRDVINQIQGTLDQREYPYSTTWIGQVASDLDRARFALGENPNLLRVFQENRNNLANKPKVKVQDVFSREELEEREERRRIAKMTPDEFRARGDAYVRQYRQNVSADPANPDLSYGGPHLDALFNYSMAGDSARFLAFTLEAYQNGHIKYPFNEIAHAARIQIEQELKDAKR